MDCGGGNGCTTDVETDTQNCGACANICALPHTTQDCNGGHCAIGTCSPGYANCDGSAANGCETDVDTDPNNCSACDTPCVLAHAIPECTGGNCAILSCNGPYRDCDGNPANGCEVNRNTDPDNCGSCGNVCSLPNATTDCEGGTCTLTGCETGYLDCDGDPANGCETDIETDPGNCGNCGHVCFGNDMCLNGFCVH